MSGSDSDPWGSVAIRTPLMRAGVAMTWSTTTEPTCRPGTITGRSWNRLQPKVPSST